MHTIAQLIDAARAGSGIPSDNQLAPALGVSRAAVSQWRSGTNVPKDEYALRLAHLAKLPEDYVLMCVHAETATDPGAKKVLRQIAGQLKNTAAAVIAAIAVFLGLSAPAPVRASTDQYAHAQYYD